MNQQRSALYHTRQFFSLLGWWSTQQDHSPHSPSSGSKRKTISLYWRPTTNSVCGGVGIRYLAFLESRALFSRLLLLRLLSAIGRRDEAATAACRLQSFKLLRRLCLHFPVSSHYFALLCCWCTRSETMHRHIVASVTLSCMVALLRRKNVGCRRRTFKISNDGFPLMACVLPR